MPMTSEDKKDLALAAWATSVDAWISAASDSIEELEEKSKREEEQITSLIERMGEVGERLAALEQIYNKSKQAPAPQYTNCHCKVCSPPKADPGPGFYYCPSCGTRQITGSFHYCPGKMVRPSPSWTDAPDEMGSCSAATYTAPEGGQSIMATPTSPVYGQRGAAPLCGPESAPVPVPPLGGQTEEEIRKAARLAAGKLWTSGFVYRVDY